MSFYELCDMLRLWLQRKNTRLRIAISIQAQIGACLYYISDEGRYRKTANVSGDSGTSISSIIRRVSHAVTTFLGPQLMNYQRQR